MATGNARGAVLRRQPRNTALRKVISSYLESGDFNGMPVPWRGMRRVSGRALQTLLRSGEIEVIAEGDFPNPHVRPWACRRSVDSQIASLHDAISGKARICVYPTARALVPLLSDGAYQGAPYTRRMAEGSGALDVIYFTLDVLEPYRNDPRYHFLHWDFGLDLSIGDEAFEDKREPEKDKIAMKSGFAYLFPDDKGSAIQRFACAFCSDLAGLSPEHQRRWSSYEVSDPDPRLHPHPQWWAAMMGEFPDGLGPFHKLRAEIEALDGLFKAAFGEPLFKSTQLPAGFHWVLRPSQAEWDAFVMSFDKLISDNIRHEAMNALKAPKTGPDGAKLGTLARFEQGLREASGVKAPTLRKVFKPFREIREARSKPAHHLRCNVTDTTIVAKQRDLLAGANGSLVQLRYLLSLHPANKLWKQPDTLDLKTYLL